MTGKLKRHDVDAIYEAAFQRARHLRWPPWPDLKPRRRGRRGRRFALILVSTVAVLCTGLGIYAASEGRIDLPTLESALRSLSPFDRKVASAPDTGAVPRIVLAPPPESPTLTAEAPPPPPDAPVVTKYIPPAPESASTVAGTAPVPPVPVPAPPTVAAVPTEADARAPSPPEASPPAPSVADTVSDATAASDPSAAKSVPVSRAADSVQKGPPTVATSPPSFPLPPRRPVLAANRAPTPPPVESAAGVGAATPAPPSSAPANGNVFHLGPGPRPTPPPAPDIVASGPMPVGGGLVGHKPASSPSSEATESSVAAAPRPCPDGSGPDCRRATHWYVGAQLSVATDAAGTFTAPGIDLKGELEKLGGTNLFAGYRSNLGTRFEAELFYRRHSFSDVMVNSDGGAGSLLGVGDLDGTSGNAQGHLSMSGMMANVFQDFRLMDSVTPFIGGGIGVARVNVSNGGLQSAALVDGNDDVFAYQIGGGVNFALDDRLDLFVEYRYFATDEYDMQYVTGDTVQGKITSHNVGVGLRYGF
jgi:opacity protein-like surface antigen